MQLLTFTLSGIFITVLSEMTIFNNNYCFIVHTLISTLNTILLHLHCKRSSIRPKQSSGNVYYSSQTLHEATTDGSVFFDKHSK